MRTNICRAHGFAGGAARFNSDCGGGALKAGVGGALFGEPDEGLVAEDAEGLVGDAVASRSARGCR